LDSETGLQYNRARDYNATDGRWTSQDPLGFAAADSNLYRYVGNSPTLAPDPSGLLKESWAKKLMNRITPAPPAEVRETNDSEQRHNRALLISNFSYNQALMEAWIETNKKLIVTMVGAMKAESAAAELINKIKDEFKDLQQADLEEIKKKLQGEDIDVFVRSYEQGKANVTLTLFYNNKDCTFVALFEGQVGTKVGGTDVKPKPTDQGQLQKFGFTIAGVADKRGNVDPEKTDENPNWIKIK
jgi:RHS repeat-associated protein